MPFAIITRFNLIPQVQANIVGKTIDAIRDSATYARDYAKTIAPVDTGAFRASLYVNGPNDESDYGERTAAAIELRPNARIVPELKAASLDPQVDRLRDRLGRFSLPEAVISSSVEYSLYLEEGTVHSSPRPTLRPAALVAEQRFKALMAEVAD